MQGNDDEDDQMDEDQPQSDDPRELQEDQPQQPHLTQ